MNDEGESTVVASFPKNQTEAICLGISEFRGKTYLFVRTFVPALSGDGLIPTPKGISLPIGRCGELVQAIRALGDVMGPAVEAGRIKKNERDDIRVGTSEYAGHRLLDIRTYSKFGNQAEPHPTPRGVSMNVELYPQLLDAAEQLAVVVAALEKSS